MEFPERTSDKTTETLRTEILKLSGQARERWVVEQVKLGLVPNWMKLTTTVIVQRERLISIEVAPDYLTLGDNEDWFIVPVTMVTAQVIADMIGAVLPTKKMVNIIYEQAQMKLEALEWGPPYDATMSSSKRFLGQAAKDYERSYPLRRTQDGPLSLLAAGHRKDYVVCPQLDARHTAIYGWFRSNHVPIQGPSIQYSCHSADYVDYSQAPRFVDFKVNVDGTMTDYDECLSDPMIGRALSDTSSKVWRHPAV